jgi:hypothetical protein
MTKQQVDEVLSSYVEEFKECIEYHANTYKLMGMGLDESPMWFQYRGTEDLIMRFMNSQRSGIWFNIKLKDEDVDLVSYSDFNWIYEFFRNVKYDYLKENHPTVYSQIR